VQIVKFTINGKECSSEKGKLLVDAAKENGIYIPTLCNYSGIPPKGSCRICTVLVNGRPATACTTKVGENLDIKTSTPELEEFRKKVIELLFAEGNHFCPSCEKSGNCELQALGYRYNILVSEFQYQFPVRRVEAWHPKLILDHNRCILCKRCIRGIKNSSGQSIFAYNRRAQHVEIIIDNETSRNMSDELAQKVMDICPVGAILVKEKGFSIPIGKRKYDHNVIGSDIEKKPEEKKL
ncbi:MAG TPA: 2Fe-2S iron-sulfur cluster-binding protein, partial [Candidatus Goldiibacteriota bacterium]|nr:2Fe-2S iron-sulfur cluster-binding protein [Candidatus Goldiibacteriota bacterium]